MGAVVNWFLFLPLAALLAGSLLSLSSSPHWFVRGWDFPLVQIVVTGWLLALLLCALRSWGFAAGSPPTWLVIGIAIVLTVWHGLRIWPYTPLAKTQAKSTEVSFIQQRSIDPAAIRLVISNVEEENHQYDLWMSVISTADPDVLILLEPDKRWVAAIAKLLLSYPHQVLQPQENWYGMVLLSKLPIEKYEVRFLIQDDVPSIDASIRIKDGTLIRVVAVHPRPPEPIRDHDSIARDAELILWGKELADEQRPVIICGDLNDVAWSATTGLFLRLSGLLDPRRGRGFFNSFHADHAYMRFPVDQLFHSNDFTVSQVTRLSHVGSDHFPIQVDLRHSPSRQAEHEELPEKSGDHKEANTLIERAVPDEKIDGETGRNRKPSIQP